jgi:hypothetical protein
LVKKADTRNLNFPLKTLLLFFAHRLCFGAEHFFKKLVGHDNVQFI